jgi:hypothetical protein
MEWSRIGHVRRLQESDGRSPFDSFIECSAESDKSVETQVRSSYETNLMPLIHQN